MDESEKLGWEILHVLEEDRRWRRQNPDRFFAEIAEDLWRTMPDDEALDHFRLRLDNVAWWASDVVECIERVLEERPHWVVRTLVEASERGAWLGGSIEDDSDRYLDWLAAQAGEMRRALDEASDSPA